MTSSHLYTAYYPLAPWDAHYLHTVPCHGGELDGESVELQTQDLQDECSAWLTLTLPDGEILSGWYLLENDEGRYRARAVDEPVKYRPATDLRCAYCDRALWGDRCPGCEHLQLTPNA